MAVCVVESVEVEPVLTPEGTILRLTVLRPDGRVVDEEICLGTSCVFYERLPGSLMIEN